MPNMEERLKSPDTKILATYIEYLDDVITQGIDTGELKEPMLVYIVDSLRWICQFIDNRRAYHKTKQHTRAEELRLMREALKGNPQKLAEIQKRAADLAANKIVDESDEPDEGPGGRS